MSPHPTIKHLRPFRRRRSRVRPRFPRYHPVPVPQTCQPNNPHCSNSSSLKHPIRHRRQTHRSIPPFPIPFRFPLHYPLQLHRHNSNSINNNNNRHLNFRPSNKACPRQWPVAIVVTTVTKFHCQRRHQIRQQCYLPICCPLAVIV